MNDKTQGRKQPDRENFQIPVNLCSGRAKNQRVAEFPVAGVIPLKVD